METISLDEAVNFITKLSKGKIFSVEFIKRTNNQIRKMVCSYGVKKYVTGVGASYDFSSEDLICVYDHQKKGYRMISKEGIRKIKIKGQTYEVVR